MHRWKHAALLITLAGCAFVSKNEFLELWDQDGDGWGGDEDCNDRNGFIFPWAPDVRGDGCDADCGQELDSDGDDWPDDSDCDPNDPDIHPCSAAEVPGDGVDSDCDGNDDKSLLPCNQISGWPATFGPDFDWDSDQYTYITSADCTHSGEPILNDMFTGEPPGEAYE